MSHKQPFSALIVGLLEGQKPLQEHNEFLSVVVQPYVFRVKENGVISEGEQSAGVAMDPSVATESQPENTSSTVTSYFRVELRAIKEKQG